MVQMIILKQKQKKKKFHKTKKIQKNIDHNKIRFQTIK